MQQQHCNGGAKGLEQPPARPKHMVVLVTSSTACF